MSRADAASRRGAIVELPERVRNQIAAGEVVERPASLVRELVENALDAGAREVRVDLEEGGVKLVRVVDDGSGMGAEDLALAFHSHATSKLREVADLDHIASLGFRGEALAAIGAVARARILSRPPDQATGYEVADEGGSIGAVGEAGGPRGTTVEVRDLFYNTPARRRFLKRTATELGRCLDVVQRLIVAHEGVGFAVTHDGKRVFDVEGGMDRRARIRRLFGADLADALVEVGGVDGDRVLAGFVAPPRFARTDTTRQMWFLNGRPLRDRLLIRCLKQAYHGFSVESRQPVAFLSLSMDPGAVDVNVHPTKSEVRFRDQRRLFGFLLATLRRGVAATDMATPGGSLLSSAARRGGWSPSPAAAATTLPDPGALSAPGSAAGSEELAVYEVPGRPFVPDAPAPPTTGWEVRDELGGPYLRIAKTYLVRALPDGFEIVDQHALHERLTFEGLKLQLRAGGVEVQRQLVPELVELSRADVKLVVAHLEALAAIGIHLEPFGATTIAVQGLPALLRRVEPERIVHDVIGLLERGAEPPSAEEFLEEVLHSMACRSSVMAGDELADEEIRALLERAAELECAQTCPHGRPTRVKFTLADLEKAFHRR